MLARLNNSRMFKPINGIPVFIITNANFAKFSNFKMESVYCTRSDYLTYFEWRLESKDKFIIIRYNLGFIFGSISDREMLAYQNIEHIATIYGQGYPMENIIRSIGRYFNWKFPSNSFLLDDE